MKNKTKEVAVLFLISSLVALVPASMLWYRSLPQNHADSAGQLEFQVFSQERHNIEAELGERDSRLVSEQESDARWALLKTSMLEQGATLKETEEILWRTKSFSRFPDWPIFIKRCYIKGKPVWFSVCAARSDNPQEAEIATGWDYWTCVIDPQNPGKVIGPYSSRARFPRCYGPNSPFPIAQ